MTARTDGGAVGIGRLIGTASSCWASAARGLERYWPSESVGTARTRAKSIGIGQSVPIAVLTRYWSSLACATCIYVVGSYWSMMSSLNSKLVVLPPSRVELISHKYQWIPTLFTHNMSSSALSESYNFHGGSQESTDWRSNCQILPPWY
jgi:hypothetical protein